MMDMSDFLTATPRIAKDTGRNTGEIKTRTWVNLPMSFWALLEQIRTDPSHPIFDNVNDTISYCIMAKARDLGLETG